MSTPQSPENRKLNAVTASSYLSQRRGLLWGVALILLVGAAFGYYASQTTNVPDVDIGNATDTSVSEIVSEVPALNPMAPEAVVSPSPKTEEMAPGISSEILRNMKRCLQAETTDQQEPVEGPENSKVRLLRAEEAVVEIEKDLGPAMMQGDLWTDWIVKLPEGMDRKVHLENIEDQDGRMYQNLTLFQMDPSGVGTRIFLTEPEERNPDMATISNLLNEGEIQRKESARYYQFATGERLEIIELDGQPLEFEIVRGEVFFRCENVQAPDNCTCIR